ncbi:6-phosphofructo-2-kinase NDAI_0B03660 [Naumovozyma dairenensis CBS 421]|uniref:6-phosphofructo-2-kinase domain-containing protein n=1 Tax=Naumovozyma dairenensis (strain ATCC 10597 / BCRC 20456 / CBS 421 / NBRC 0211 / NRRL Y-12639) TaxID=1071378 RepID=G0W6I9_NAUDC|nr:hypothetical protein NDAI_0B03660 [Naumovozyma dairenensis CBS 421]CCD23400.1 hypothetical protein NDAI_0B03660 [Naumovozyma dairenensis CBS 421]
MFKRVDYSQNSSKANSLEPEHLEPTETPPELIPTPEYDSCGPLRSNSGNNMKKIASGSSSGGALSSLPSFHRRPLTDTPITSEFASPGDSHEATPEVSPKESQTELKNLLDKHNQHDNKNSKDGNETINNNSIRSFAAASTAVTSDSTSTSTATLMTDSTIVNAMTSKISYPKRRPTTIDVPGLTKSKTSPDGIISSTDYGSKLVIVMVGLPATGKSFITNKLSRYLNYSMYYCKVFNVGNTRRQFTEQKGLSEQDSKFFDPKNPESTKLREKWAMDTLDELLNYLSEGPGCVGIFDATNTTKERRKHLLEKIRKRNKYLKVLFLESICSNKDLVEKNVKLKLFGPDYKGKNPDQSLKDFRDRLKNYMQAYEPIEDSEGIQYIKMIDVGKKVIAYNIEGFLASQTVYYLLNFNLTERQIWITRNGESVDNARGRIGGNSHLTSRGDKYAKCLAKFMDKQRIAFYTRKIENESKSKEDGKLSKRKASTVQLNDFFVWTSMLTRSIETAKYFNEDDYPIKQMKMLDELGAGDFEGMTYPEIQGKFPEEFEERQKDKLRYRYPGMGGESYMDVINRLRPVITELERIEDNVLIITHRVVARALLGYYMNLDVDIIANLDIPLHCVYCLEPKPYGITWSLWEYDEEDDDFYEVPASELNTTRVKEIGLVHKERRYSVVPTAPSSSVSSTSDFLSKRPLSKSTSLNENGLVDTQSRMNKLDMLDGGGTSISTFHSRQVPNRKFEHPNPKNKLLNRQNFEIDRLNEKLSLLKTKYESTEKNNENKSSPRGTPPMTRSQSHNL